MNPGLMYGFEVFREEPRYKAGNDIWLVDWGTQALAAAGFYPLQFVALKAGRVNLKAANAFVGGNPTINWQLYRNGKPFSQYYSWNWSGGNVMFEQLNVVPGDLIQLWQSPTGGVSPSDFSYCYLGIRDYS